MILIVLAACFWGITNPFLKNGALGWVFSFSGQKLKILRLEKESTLFGKIKRLVTNWQFLVPFGLNQFGSLFYYYSMGQYPISIAVTGNRDFYFVVYFLKIWNKSRKSRKCTYPYYNNTDKLRTRRSKTCRIRVSRLRKRVILC